MHGLFFLVCNVSSVLMTGRSRCTLFTFLHLIRYSFSKIILLLAVPLLAPHTTDSRILHCHLAVCRKEAFPFRWARVERCHALRVIRPWGTKLVLCHPQRGSQTIWSEKKLITKNVNQILAKLIKHTNQSKCEHWMNELTLQLPQSESKGPTRKWEKRQLQCTNVANLWFRQRHAMRPMPDSCCLLWPIPWTMPSIWWSLQLVIRISSISSNKAMDANRSSIQCHRRICVTQNSNLRKIFGWVYWSFFLTNLNGLNCHLLFDAIHICDGNALEQGDDQQWEIPSEAIHQLEYVAAGTVSKAHRNNTAGHTKSLKVCNKHFFF